MYVIEKNIPIPADRQSQAGTFKGLLGSMDVGDSIAIESSKRASLFGTTQLLRPKKFLSRKQDDGRVRVWRVQ